mgnify:CR=1 FL=1
MEILHTAADWILHLDAQLLGVIGVERMLRIDEGCGAAELLHLRHERVRERGAVFEPALSRVALNEAGEVVGVCRIWRAEAGVPVYFLGPLAVDPAAQAAGLGAELTRDAVVACRSIGTTGIVLVGAERFFSPIGFAQVPKGLVTLPGPVDPARLLWLELRPGGLDKVQGELRAPR